MKKYIGFFVILLVIALGVLSVSAQTVTGNLSGNISWTYESESATLTVSGNGAISNTYGTVSVFAGQSFFNDFKTLVIEEGITRIDDLAFHYCSSLESISFPNTLTYIGREAFSYCNELKTVNLPASLAEIGNYPFLCCSQLEEINVDKDSVAFSSVDGVLFSKDKTKLWIFPTFYANPAYAVPRGTVTIANYAFYNCLNLASLKLPDTVTTIEDMAFINCFYLTSAKIPASVTTIGAHIFGGTYNVVVNGYAGSDIETYAAKNGVKFTAIAECSTHSFGDWVVVQKATVDTVGKQYRECKNCFASESETLPKLDPENLPVGDFDGDGEVSIADAMTILAAFVNERVLAKSDIDGDGATTLLDVIRVLKLIV